MEYLIVVLIDLLIFSSLIVFYINFFNRITDRNAPDGYLCTEYKNKSKSSLPAVYLLSMFSAIIFIPLIFSFVYYYPYKLLLNQKIEISFYCSYIDLGKWIVNSLMLFPSFWFFLFIIISNICYKENYVEFILGYAFSLRSNNCKYNKLTETSSVDDKILKAKINELKNVVISIIGISIIMTVVFQAMSLHHTAFFCDDEIEIGYQTYSYAEIENIYYVDKYIAPNGTILNESYVAIIFSDGNIYSDRRIVERFTEEQIDTIAMRSNVTPQRIENLP